jgi:hypothetical protein
MILRSARPESAQIVVAPGQRVIIKSHKVKEALSVAVYIQGAVGCGETHVREGRERQMTKRPRISNPQLWSLA